MRKNVIGPGNGPASGQRGKAAVHYAGYVYRFSGLLDEQWKRDLSDLIYYYKQGRFHGLQLNSVIYYLGDMAWLPPIRFPDDYNQITSEEMADFLLKILEEGGYGTLVLDIGNYGRQVLPLLEICQAVYMPIREDAVSRAKLQEFEQYVEKAGKRRWRENSIRSMFPWSQE